MLERKAKKKWVLRHGADKDKSNNTMTSLPIYIIAINNYVPVIHTDRTVTQSMVE